jgi:hypothetical protein
MEAMLRVSGGMHFPASSFSFAVVLRNRCVLMYIIKNKLIAAH